MQTEMAPKALDETNMGNKMLRAMGWKAGEGLGKSGTGMTAPLDSVRDLGGVLDSSKRGVGTDNGAGILPGDDYRTKAKKMVRIL